MQSFEIEKMKERGEGAKERGEVCALFSKLVAWANIALVSFNKGARKATMHGAFGN